MRLTNYLICYFVDHFTGICLQAGILSAFDEVLSEFLSAKPEERSDILAKGEETVANLEGKAAEYVCKLLFIFILVGKFVITIISRYGFFNAVDRILQCLLPFLYYRYGKVYFKALKSMIEKGEGYAKKEAERLTRILSGVSF